VGGWGLGFFVCVIMRRLGWVFVYVSMCVWVSVSLLVF